MSHVSTPSPPPSRPVPDEFWVMLFTLTRRPVMTMVLLAVNAAVWLLMVARGIDWYDPNALDLLAWGANSAPLTLGGQWWRLVTSLFLHAGILHLAGNLVSLYVVGPLVERLVGSAGFTLLYLVAGVAGNLVSLAWHPHGQITVGASGAIFGVLGALLGFILPQWRHVPRDLTMNLLGNGVLVIVANLAITHFVPRIDNAAHMGGLAAGAACGLLLSQPLTPRTPRRRRVRNALLAVVAAAALLVAVRFLPTAHFAFEREWDRLVDVQDRVFAEYHRLKELRSIDRIDDDQLADGIARHVLPPWQSQRQRLAALPQSSPRREAFRQRLLESLVRREESWELEIRALRQHDPALHRQAERKRVAANALVRQLDRIPDE